MGEHHHHHHHEKRTRLVVLLSAVTMALEIGFGYYTKSMALLADGWHMGSHVFALGLSWMAYYYARRHEKNTRFVSGTKKILALAAYTSALFLLVIAVLMIIESVSRFFEPLPVRFEEAIIISIIGLSVNGISALLLHHKHEHSDHNIKAAYIHVLADMLTSFIAIIALTGGLFFGIYALDAAGGLIGSVIIIKWAIDLIKSSGKELLDYC